MASPLILTPATAQEWLPRCVHNHRPDPARVAAFAKLMTSGGWRIDLADPRQPVVLRRIDDRLVLDDGATRLTAIIQANMLAEIYINAPPDLVIAPPQGRYLFAVSPARAATWLGAARPGRGKALEYAAIMAAGQWRSVPEDPVRLSSGRIVEGQHRLLAVTLADEPVPLWVEWQP